MRTEVFYQSAKSRNVILPAAEVITNALREVEEVIATAPVLTKMRMSYRPGSTRTGLTAFHAGLVYGRFISPQEGPWSEHDELLHRKTVEAADSNLSTQIQELAVQGLLYDACRDRRSAVQIGDVIDSLLTN